MKLKLSFFILLIINVSCTKDTIKESESKNEFVLTIEVPTVDNTKVYLYNLTPKPAVIVDSSMISNNSASFKGTIKYPERHLITIDNVFGGKLFILENDSISIKLNQFENLLDAKIIGSKINDELENYQKESEKIYNQIDLLFPDLQRARLENNPTEISRISLKMTEIDKENLDFNINYIQNNSNSFVSTMILNDLTKRDSVNNKIIKDLYQNLNSEVKKSPDALSVFEFLEQ